MLASDCLKHVQLVNWAFNNNTEVQPSAEIRLNWVSLSNSSYFSIQSRLLSVSFNLHDSAHPERPQARLIDQSWVDSSLLRSWKDKCDNCHGGRCQSPPWVRSSRIRPTRLIDVLDKCLVKTCEDVNYVALSYVWGTEPYYTTLKHNLARNQQPYALTGDNGDLQVPIAPVVLDAMGAVQLLGERYLWVDALCIVQDDYATKKTELDNMGQIYSHATITIIAGLGSGASSGLPGLKGFSAPRNAPQNICNLEPHLRAVETIEQQSGSVWRTRAWTYQEEIFSRRSLTVGEQTVEWRCASAIWFEDRYETDVPTSSHYLSTYQDVLGTVVPIPRSIGDLVDSYNARELTYHGDALNAFAGIASVLSRGLQGGLISGLPEGFFHVALLWQPEAFYEFRDNEHDPSVCIPSWSWASYKGQVRQWSWNIADQFAFEHKGHYPLNTGGGDEVYPLVQWSCREVLDSPGEEIRHTWLKYRESFDATEVKQAGWTRHLKAEDRHLTMDETAQSGRLPEYFYTHKAAPGSKYWWPVPLPGEDEPPQPQRNMPFISCRTRRGWLQGDGALRIMHSAETVVISLRTANSAWTGAIGVMGIGEIDDFESTHYDITDVKGTEDLPEEIVELASDSFELVEVARGTVGHVLSEMSYSKFWTTPLEQETPGSEVHYVMWIEWEGPVAYRRGLGRVLKSVWETIELEWIDLILG